MRKVQRFDIRGNTWSSEDGAIVSYKDYAALEKERDAECENWQKQCADLQQKLDAVLAENVMLKNGAEKCYDDITCIHNSYGWSMSEDGESETAVIDLDGAQFVIQETLLNIKTPATDVLLNAVRAEGGPSVQANDLKALMRFNETCEDGEGYDIGDQAMNRLVELGLVAKERGKMRVITSFGMWVMAREQGEESGALETQRDRDLAFQQKISQLRAETDTTSSQYESLAGGK